MDNNESDLPRQTVREEVFTRRINAGKRTYFVDVKRKDTGEHYITISESIRKDSEKNPATGQAIYEKHKIFLMEEFFFPFIDCLDEAMMFVEDSGLRRSAIMPEEGGGELVAEQENLRLSTEWPEE